MSTLFPLSAFSLMFRGDPGGTARLHSRQRNLFLRKGFDIAVIFILLSLTGFYIQLRPLEYRQAQISQYDDIHVPPDDRRLAQKFTKFSAIQLRESLGHHRDVSSRIRKRHNLNHNLDQEPQQARRDDRPADDAFIHKFSLRTPIFDPSLPVEVKRYHEYPNFEFSEEKLKGGAGSRPYTTAYEEATILETTETWFSPKQICINSTNDQEQISSCCAQTVAISLDQDDYHIINTVDGLDLADLALEKYENRPGLKFFSTGHKDGLNLSDSILPCLQPGTIIHIDNHRNLLEEFFQRIAPTISVPFVMITSESDADSPEMFGEKLGTEQKLLKWFGQSPLLERIPHDENYDRALDKFEGFPLGLSKWHDQSRYLTRYLQLRNYTNPFSKSELHRWTNATVWNVLNNATLANSSIDSIDDAFYKTLFVKFGLNAYAEEWRRPIYNNLCNQTTNRSDSTLMTVWKHGSENSVSCSLEMVQNHRLYQAASQYLFGISPRGAGWDCYRTYELLLLGVIPIVPARPGGTHNLFQNLPLLEMEEEMMMNSSHKEMMQFMFDYVQSDAFQKADFDRGWERLFLRYRRRHVLKAAKRDKDILTDPKTGRMYYQAWKYWSPNNIKVD